MPQRVKPSELINRLNKRKAESADELRRRLKLAQKSVAARIEALAERQAAAANAGARNNLYKEITSIYDVQAAEYDQWMLDQVGKTAIEWNGQAKKDLKTMGGKTLVKFDRSLVKRYWELVHGGNQKHLAGVFTDKMAASDMRHLRTAFIDTFRQQSIEGWTARETQKALQDRWDGLAKNLRSDRFVDAAGKRWANSDYINMLTRTTFQKVERESYVDGVVQEGYELARIVSDGDPCDICKAWDGLIVDISGSQKSDYPSLSQAYDGGWGHPNCGCRLEAMIPAVDGKENGRKKSRR